ncbi:hypothetical protein Mal52_44810 [Symmachiella dynata]|uniref:Uncharacterized protein n=1 Tax=Symmachiella dynata TaxID=2527995 RepID=A0A517ZU45_9PLAN|nr:hypothetical protein Mal52_44810 [Symmachiella dynata]
MLSGTHSTPKIAPQAGLTVLAIQTSIAYLRESIAYEKIQSKPPSLACTSSKLEGRWARPLGRGGYWPVLLAAIVCAALIQQSRQLGFHPASAKFRHGDIPASGFLTDGLPVREWYEQ